MLKQKNQNLTECPVCRKRYDANLKDCSHCGAELPETGRKTKLPLIFYPILILFGIYILWELTAWLFRSP